MEICSKGAPEIKYSILKDQGEILEEFILFWWTNLVLDS